MSSKFANLLSQARSRPNDENEPEVEQGSEPTTTTQETKLPLVATVTASAAPTTQSEGAESSSPTRQKSAPTKSEPKGTDPSEPSGPGRPRTGKRSDPNYTQITAYIREDTHRDVKLALLQEDEGREISEVIEELLAFWLEGRR